ncbi:hypothetical protein LUZ63_002768 [Rhynchospora breviuscula]|uniref:Mechanosensitive ion channel MscS domain-containing protein n=1 Tax=Rhynchospora breviuscula TaxID=2022672 RepID=A0A9Q0HY38_9POAL|nr:hypothetical protein LUZ63_002768 [Rhynchospora breviuscula]
MNRVNKLLGSSYLTAGKSYFRERTIKPHAAIINSTSLITQAPERPQILVSHSVWQKAKVPVLHFPPTHTKSFRQHMFHSQNSLFPTTLSITTYHRSYSSSAQPNSSDDGTKWTEFLDKAYQSTRDATTTVSNKAKEISDSLMPHLQQWYESNPNWEKVVVPVGGTLFGSVLAWFVMPVLFRQFHKYTSQNNLLALLGGSPKIEIPYKNSMWNALEDPAKYLITFMAFSEIGAMIAPSISAHLPQLWRGAAVVSLVWFLQRWKTNFLSSVVTNQVNVGLDREKLSALDKVSSLGLIVLGVMGLAEACGVAVQSILTVGGVGGVATAFAARDILGNMLSGFSLQFSKPFSIGDNIKAGSIDGQVIDIGLTTTSLINPEKFPVIVPNSLFSSQVIVNKSRAQWRSSLTKVPIRVEDIDKIPPISEEIKKMLKSNPQVFLGQDAPFCYLSRLESSHGELTIGCNLKSMRKDELFAAEQDILIQAAKIIRQNGAELGSTLQSF